MANELTVREQFAALTTPVEQLQKIVAELPPMSFSDLDQIKVPAAGGTAWEMPDGNPEREFEAIILHARQGNVYWGREFGQESPDPENRGPLCQGSFVKGVGFVGSNTSFANGKQPLCEDCQFNFNGCRGFIEMLVLLPGNGFMPTRIRVPGGSVRNLNRYFRELVLKHQVAKSAVVTRFALTKETGKNNITFSQVQVKLAQQLSNEDAERVTAVAKALAALMRRGAQQSEGTPQTDPVPEAPVNQDTENPFAGEE